MAKTTGRQAEGGAGVFPGVDPAQMATNFESMFQAGTKMLDHWRVVSEELMEFGRSRLTKSMEVGRKVAQSASIDQAIEAQAEYARTTMQDYIAESSKLAELGTRALFGSLSAWQPAPASESRPEPAEAGAPPRRAAAE